jgi:hypothetical protein
LVATLAEKGRALLELDPIAFTGLLAWADAAIMFWKVRRSSASPDAKSSVGSTPRADFVPAGEVN